MGVKVTSGMYCVNCLTPVAAQKSTHRLRNLSAAMTAPVTAGLSLAGAKAGDWHCPRCGGQVIPARAVERERAKARQAQELAPQPALERPRQLTPAASTSDLTPASPHAAPHAPPAPTVPPTPAVAATDGVDWSRFFE